MRNISIIIPAKDEEKRLPGFLRKILDYCREDKNSYEIIVVDDGSQDHTVQVTEAFQRDFSNIKMLSLDRNHGKGYAVKQGFLAAQGEVVLFLDADGSTGPQEIGRYLSLLDHDCDIVIGSRSLDEGGTSIKARFYRKFMGGIFNFFVSTLLIKGIKDTQCGFKMFKAPVAKDIFSRVCLEGFGFDLEVLYLAQKMNHRIKEVPVHWTHVEGSKVHLLKDSLRMFNNIFQIRNRHYD